MTSPHRDLLECPREGDVLDALASARWPNRMAAELANHVASCEICTDVIAVAAALREEQDASWHEAGMHIPSSGQMWWRAEMRARQQAIRNASRPVTVAQAVAIVLALAVAGVAGWFAWPAVQSFFAPESLAKLPVTSPMFVPLAVAMATLVIVVAPVALYLVLSDQPD